MTARGRTLVTNSPAPRTTVPATDGSVDVSAIFVTFGTGSVVIDAIDSVVRTLSTIDTTFEIVVVDNPHPEVDGVSMRELALSTAGVRVVAPTRNLGFAGGCELGALHARGSLLAFLNPDIVVPDGWFEGLHRRLVQGATVAAPVLVHADGRIQEAGAWLDADGGTHPRLTPDDDDDVDYASAACWLVSRDDHERLGGFDAAYYPAFYEDVDLALRLRSSGGCLDVAADVRVVHHRGAGSLRVGGPPDTSDQRDRLLERHPSVRWTSRRDRPTNAW